MDMMQRLLVKKMRESAVLPKRGTEGSAGLDLCACLGAPVHLAPGEIVKVPTGVAIGIGDPGYVGLVFARSGLSSKHGIALANGVGVIDSDYTGEIFVPLVNNSVMRYTVRDGDRIAQLCVMPVCPVQVCETDVLEPTGRGAGGFGSTGYQADKTEGK